MSRRNLLSRKNTTPAQKSRIVFKTDSSGSVNINVVGKGISLKNSDGVKINTNSSSSVGDIYLASGVYTLEARSLTICRFRDSSLTSVEEFKIYSENVDLTNCFAGCSLLKQVRGIDISNCKSALDGFFASCSSLTYIEPFYKHADMTTAVRMFQNARITEFPLLNPENISDVSYMLSSTSITDLSGIQNKVLNWVNVSETFSGISATTIENLNLPEALTFKITFGKVINLNNIQLPKATSVLFSNGVYYNNLTALTEVSNIYAPSLVNCDNMFISSFALQAVVDCTFGQITSAKDMFKNCYELLAAPALDYSKCSNLNSTFSNCRKLVDISNFNPGDVPHTMNNCFESTLVNNIDHLNFSNCLEMKNCFSSTKITSITNKAFTGDIQNAFQNCALLTTVSNVVLDDVVNAANLFQSTSITSASIKFKTSNSNLDQICDYSNLLSSNSNLTTLSLDFSEHYKPYKATSFASSCGNLTNLTGLDFRQCVDSRSMFYSCSKLEGNLGDLVFLRPNVLVNGMFSYTRYTSIGNVSVPNSATFVGAFTNMTPLVSIGNLSFSTSVPSVDISSLFYQNRSLKTKGAITGNIGRINSTFCNTGFTSLELDYPLVTDASDCCTNSTSLTTVNINLPNCTNFERMFQRCWNLTSVTSTTLTLKGLKGASMFESCLKLVSIPSFIYFEDFSDISYMFSYCEKIELTLINKVFQNIKVASAFRGTKLRVIENVLVENSDTTYLFADCGVLTSVTNLVIDCQNLNGTSWNHSRLFYNCSGITGNFDITFTGSGQIVLDQAFSAIPRTYFANYTVRSAPVFTYENLFGSLPTTISYLGIENVAQSYESRNRLQYGSTITIGKLKNISLQYFSYLTSINEIEYYNKALNITYNHALTSIGSITAPYATGIYLNINKELTSVGPVDAPLLLEFALYGTKITSPPIIVSSDTRLRWFSFQSTKITSYDNTYNLSNLQNFASAFDSCTELKTVNISDTFPGPVRCTNMFSGSNKIESITLLGAENLRDSYQGGGDALGLTDAMTQLHTLVIPGYRCNLSLPTTFNDVNKLEAVINGLGTPLYPNATSIKIGQTRKNSLNPTVVSNAEAKGWRFL